MSIAQSAFSVDAMQRDIPAPIPSGVADYFGEDARRRRQLETKLLDSFRTWGYQDVIPPTFEYGETFSARISEQLRHASYRFLDRDGAMLSLRPEMTVAVARLVGTRLHDWEMPLRFCYAGPVYRYAQLQAGRQREFMQAGVELFGAAGADADAEILALTCRALEEAGLRHFRLALGQLAYFNGLLDALQLSPAGVTALQQAVDRNSEAELADFLARTPLATEQRRAVEVLSTLSGDDAETILQRARSVCLTRQMDEAIDNLYAILNVLDARGIAERIFIDLTEIHNLGYYTGITFEALAPALGFPLASGGRYDNLVGTFGPPQPAVGVAFTLDWMLMAQNAQADQTDTGAAQMKSITVALPKGRMADDALALFAQAGVPLPSGDPGRKLVLSSADGTVRYIMAKPTDVPTFVEYGAADLGVCGMDVLRESGRNVYEPLLLPFARCRLSLAGPAGRPDTPLRYLTQARVATKYPRLANDFFRQRGINAEIIELNGSVELGPLVGLVDFIVDIIETGSTLRANGLEEYRTILESQGLIIVNRASQRLKSQAVQQTLDQLRKSLQPEYPEPKLVVT